MRPRYDDGFYPLSRWHVEEFTPAAPGVYALAILLANGTHHVFHSTETVDLRTTLLAVAAGEEPLLPPFMREYLSHFQCYLRYDLLEAPPRRAGEVARTPSDLGPLGERPFMLSSN
jgi:hypothetical protein